MSDEAMSGIDALYQEAEKLKDDGKLQQAVAKLDEILAVNEGHVLSHLTLAVVLGRLGDHEKAIEHGERACQLEPQDPFNFTAMSVTYMRALHGTNDEHYKLKAEDAMAQAHLLEGG